VLLKLLHLGLSPASPDVAAAQGRALVARLPRVESLRSDLSGSAPFGAGVLEKLGCGCRRLRELHLARLSVRLGALHKAAADGVLFLAVDRVADRFLNGL
jgi:hypothetical protein